MPRLLLLAVLLPGSLLAQMQVGVRAELGVASAYVDRGVTLTNAPVLLPALFGGPRLGGGQVELGVRAVIEPATYADPDIFTMADTLKRPRPTELRPTLRLSQPLAGRLLHSEFQVEYRMFSNAVGITKEANTGRFTTTLGAPGLPLQPWVAVGYELGAVRGGFVDVGARQAVTLLRGLAVEASGRASWSVRQEVDGVGGTMLAYERNGPAFAELTAAVPLTIAGATVRPYGTYLMVAEPVAPIDGRAVQRARYFYFGMTLAVAGSFPKPPPPKKPRR